MVAPGNNSNPSVPVVYTGPTPVWYLDIKEKWRTASGDVRYHIFSIELAQLEFEKEQPLFDLVDTINTQFYQAAKPLAWTSPEPSPGNSETWVRYLLTAQARIPADYTTITPPEGVEVDPNEPFSVSVADEVSSFAIEYNLKQHPDVPYNAPPSWGTLVEFTLELRDGLHGYETIPDHASDTPYGDVYIENYPSTEGVVLDYSSHLATVLDRPPVPPNIKIVPFVGVSNKVLLLLNSNTGEYLARPVVILDSDADAIANQYVSLTGTPINPADVREEIHNPASALKLQYKTDDPISKYEVFRLTTKPTSYEDFNTTLNPYDIVSGEVTMRKKSSAAFLIDDIEPNTKYYYCARAVDVHNNFSNPTHVFEVEMADNDGQVYLILKTILFDAPDADTIKTGKKFIYIEPSARNMDIPSMPVSDSSVDDIPNTAPAPLFGALDGGNACWGKTFKVRLTSKKSNKKIDLNILFKNTGVLNP